MDLDAMKSAPCWPVPTDDGGRAEQLELLREWRGSFCSAKLMNRSTEPARVREIVLAEIRHDLPDDTKLYAEGFTMLSQTGGTLGEPVDLCGLTDRKHYRIPQPDDATVVYGMLTLKPPGGRTILMAFTSCRRFVGRFYLRPGAIQVVFDAEGLTLGPGEEWQLEEFMFAEDADRDGLLESLAGRIARHHKPLRFEPVPTGWCSWYCFGPGVTAEQVLANLETIADRMPQLKYVQIDDGYQAAMGDWLEPGKAFGGGLERVLKEIRRRGLQPGIWVAPFIAEEGSRVFREHPDWFVRDASGAPLRSDRVTFGGWRNAPWYALDGTHPQAREHLEGVFRTMREQWGCNYFKLDANFWGAIHGGRFRDPQATRVEAYRRGMEAVLAGAGDSFILGCNHPLWPSLGLIHGSRSSNDISRNWGSISNTAVENLSRNWQNGRLWWNDPDVVVLTGDLPESEFYFHATVIYATGGLVLAGDDLTKMPPERMAMLRKLLPPTGASARFQDDAMRVGVVSLKGRTMLCLLNWDDQASSLSVALPGRGSVRDYWTGAEVEAGAGVLELKDMPPRSARLLACE